jgi:molybdopterin synthase sulfur carrier subunit
LRLCGEFYNLGREKDMAVKVRIPSPLQKLTKNQSEVTASGENIKELFADLEKQYPGIRDRLYDENGNLRRFINVYINEEDIRFLKNEESEIKDGDNVSIIPAIAGGSQRISNFYDPLSWVPRISNLGILSFYF